MISIHTIQAAFKLLSNAYLKNVKLENPSLKNFLKEFTKLASNINFK
ncbi:MAG: hypothetical protein BAJALOKI3v1_30042 [Promethearchaeota archaeon]|nr:MAG: hypothetical protein BAJALOKI3v1_30042 [Candidatus Lokiarchaeota archaeon]